MNADKKAQNIDLFYPRLLAFNPRPNVRTTPANGLLALACSLRHAPGKKRQTPGLDGQLHGLRHLLGFFARSGVERAA
jgi:hypothetical protein